MPELAAEGITVYYGRVRAIRDVEIGLDPGELVVLLGANGAGKTTTLRALSGLEPTTSGAIEVSGADLTGASPERFATAGVVHIPEGRGIFGRLTVEQNIVMGLYPRRRSRPDRRAAVEAAVERFPELGGRRRQRAATLSGGEQQMLAVARALAAEPRFLLLDEPSQGLAPLVVDRLFELLDELRTEGLGVLAVEQHLTAAVGRADRVHLLERGEVTYAGAPSGLDTDDLMSAYLGGGR